MKKNDGSTSKVITTTAVGQKISTKSVGSDDREDITHLYKYPEGTTQKNINRIRDELTFQNVPEIQLWFSSSAGEELVTCNLNTKHSWKMCTSSTVAYTSAQFLQKTTYTTHTYNLHICTPAHYRVIDTVLLLDIRLLHFLSGFSPVI